MRESKLQTRCVAWARRRGVLVTKNDSHHNAGVPDYTFWLPGGRPLVVEFKKPDGEFRPRQPEILTWLAGAGYNAVVVEKFEQFLAAAEGVLRETSN